MAQSAAYPTGGGPHFQVDGDRLQLEWVEQWGYGHFTPPTVEGGFGSTVDAGFRTGAHWVQIYRRRE